MERSKILFLLIMIVATLSFDSCKNESSETITVVPLETENYLVYELENVKIYLPKENVVQYSDSVCKNKLGYHFCYISDYFLSRSDSIITINYEETTRNIYRYIKETYGSETFKSYDDFLSLYYGYQLQIVSEYLKLGEVKILNKKSSKYVKSYELKKTEDENGTETEYYYLDDNILFFEIIVSLGL